MVLSSFMNKGFITEHFNRVGNIPNDGDLLNV